MCILNDLQTLYENGVNGILADEMGLGKTVQCVAMFAHLVYMGVSGPFLICAPLSTIPNWYSEFQKFAPKVSTEWPLAIQILQIICILHTDNFLECKEA